MTNETFPADKARAVVAAMRKAMRRDDPAYTDGAFLTDMSSYVRALEDLLPASDYQPGLPAVRMSPYGLPYVPVAGMVSGDTGKATVNSWGQIALVNAPVLADTTDGVREQCRALLALCDYLDNPDNQVNARCLDVAHWRHAARPTTEDGQ